ncbi:MAG: tetratricopeptide repeat protein [Elusimicrobiota bacterium]
MKRVVICIILIFNFAYFLHASIRDNLSKGNRAYKKENYDVALEKYKVVEANKPNLPEAQFNIGNVYYKTGMYEDALKNYEKTTYSKDIKLQGKAYYNMGNCLFRTKKLPEAIQFYKKAIELNPNDVDAKFNIEFAQKKLKENIDKNSKQSEQNKESQDQKDKDKKQQEKKKNEETKEQENKKKEEQEKGEEDQKQKMSKEDANRIIESTGDEKKPKEKANIKIPLFKMPEKDW